MSNPGKFAAAIICALPCFSDFSFAADPIRGTFLGSFLYNNAERTSFFAIKSGQAEVGLIAPRRPLGNQRAVQVDTSQGALIFDCSDQKSRCVRFGRNALAVPLARMLSTMSYTAAGTRFSVQTCIRGVGRFCQIALIVGDCNLINDALGCEVVRGGRNKSPRPGPLTYFIYNEDFGITSLGIMDDEVMSKQEAMMVAKTYHLQGSAGLFKSQ